MRLEDVFCGRKVLVTGHTGFKGTWLSLWLHQLGAEVVGLSLNVPTQPSHFEAAGLADLLSEHRVDLRKREDICRVMQETRPDFVFHLAAQALVRRAYADPVSTYATNLMGTVNVLEGLRTLKHPCVAVLITSDKCYDNMEWEWGYRETDALGGPDPYSGSKGAAELAIRSYVRSYFPRNGALRIGVARAGNVIGGGDWAEDRIVPDCVRAWSRGETVPLRNPSATRPWQHVLEPLSGYLNLAMVLHKSGELHGEPFNFGPPAHQNHAVGVLVSAMARRWGKGWWEDVSDQDAGPHESGLLKLNCDKALHHLGWRAIWDFDTTVRETAFWYRRYYEDTQSSIADFSLEQISAYVAEAQRQELIWAQ